MKTYGEEHSFLESCGVRVVELSDESGRARVCLVPAWQGRVMTSPAAFLRPGETLCHTQEVFHLQGDEALLEELLRGLIPGGLRAVKEAFNH